MIRSLLRVCCLVFVVSFATSASAYSDEQISQTLQWEQKWSKVTNRAIGKYASRLKPALKGVAPAKRERALRDVRSFMRDRFSWHRQGKHFVQVLTKSCDRNILNKMVDVKRGESVPRDQRIALVKQYKQCALPGYREAMKHLYKVTKGFKPQVDRIIDRARS